MITPDVGKSSWGVVLDLSNANAFFHVVVARSFFFPSHYTYLIPIPLLCIYRNDVGCILKVERFSPELAQGVVPLKVQLALVIRIPWGHQSKDTETFGHATGRAAEEEVGQ